MLARDGNGMCIFVCVCKTSCKYHTKKEACMHRVYVFPMCTRVRRLSVYRKCVFVFENLMATEERKKRRREKREGSKINALKEEEGNGRVEREMGKMRTKKDENI